MPKRYQNCIAKCPFPCKEDLPDNWVKPLLKDAKAHFRLTYSLKNVFAEVPYLQGLGLTSGWLACLKNLFAWAPYYSILYSVENIHAGVRIKQIYFINLLDYHPVLSAGCRKVLFRYFGTELFSGQWPRFAEHIQDHGSILTQMAKIQTLEFS